MPKFRRNLLSAATAMFVANNAPASPLPVISNPQAKPTTKQVLGKEGRALATKPPQCTISDTVFQKAITRGILNFTEEDPVTKAPQFNEAAYKSFKNDFSKKLAELNLGDKNQEAAVADRFFGQINTLVINGVLKPQDVAVLAQHQSLAEAINCLDGIFEQIPLMPDKQAIQTLVNSQIGSLQTGGFKDLANK